MNHLRLILFIVIAPSLALDQTSDIKDYGATAESETLNATASLRSSGCAKVAA